MHTPLNTMNMNFPNFSDSANFFTFNSHYFGLIALGLAVLAQVGLGLYFHKLARAKKINR
ncbi:hypothetical protein PUF88_02480 [Lactobacillaceae bacterium L1_55_11]|nr:hypothetical protein [Lactobacillaceae bacterium L1_55_11]